MPFGCMPSIIALNTSSFSNTGICPYSTVDESILDLAGRAGSGLFT